MPKLFKKILVSFFIFLILFSSFAFVFKSNAKAEWFNPTYQEWHGKVHTAPSSEIFGERYTSAQVWWIIYSLISFAVDTAVGTRVSICLTDPDIVTCLKAIPELQAANIKQNSNSLVQEIFRERPVSAVTYFSDIARNIKLIPEAKAQTGFGFTALNPILGLWKAMRNATFALFIVAIIAMAFMIMFRIKISPQAVITVQSALPKLAIALILVTFSYAIAGLLIDLMYVVTGLLSLLIANSGMIEGNTAVDMFDLFTKGPEILGANTGIFGFVWVFWIKAVVTSFTVFLSADSPAIFGATGLFSVLLLTVGILAMLWINIRLLFMLFKNLALLLISTIFAPFQILLGLVSPSMGFGPWLRNYLSLLSVFPTVGALFIFAGIFLDIALYNAKSEIFDIGFFNLIPVIGTTITGFLTGYGKDSAWPPLLQAGDTTIPLVFLGAAFVTVSIIPKSVELIQSLIKGQAFNYESALGEAMGPAKLAGEAGIQKYVTITEQAGASAAAKGGKTYIPEAHIQLLKTLKLAR